MNPDTYGLIEMAMSFGVVLVFLFWQLYSVRRLIAQDARKAEDKTRE